jgi:hypothetical protein
LRGKRHCENRSRNSQCGYARDAKHWWARTVSNRRPLVCKGTGTSEQAYYDVQYVQFRNSHVFTLFRCVHPVRPCLGNLAAT